MDLIERPRPTLTTRPVIQGSSNTTVRSSSRLIQDHTTELDPDNGQRDLESMDASSSVALTDEWLVNPVNSLWPASRLMRIHDPQSFSLCWLPGSFSGVRVFKMFL